MCSCVANSKRIEQEKDKETVAVTNQEEIQENVVEETETKNELIENVAVNEEKIESQEIPQEQIVETKKEEKEVSSNVSDKTTSVGKEQSLKVNTQKQEVKNTEVQVNQKQPKIEETTIQEPKNNNVTTTKKEELKRNDKMIETIRNVIRKNETEDMKNFGYKIVVDSSIKQLTNQFTYSENRVKNYLRNKFGTIKIYAEDYYCNGEFIMTECYII